MHEMYSGDFENLCIDNLFCDNWYDYVAFLNLLSVDELNTFVHSFIILVQAKFCCRCL